MLFPLGHSLFCVRVCLCVCIHLCVYVRALPTDSNPDSGTDSQGSQAGLPSAMAGAHPHSAGVCQGPGWPAAAQSAAHLLSRHQNSLVETSGTGQTAISGCKSSVALFVDRFSLFNCVILSLFSNIVVCFQRTVPCATCR